MKKGTIIILFCAVLSCATSAVAQGPADHADIFRQANKAYGDGKYDDAIAKYESILKDGVESGNLYYNLANAYFKKGDTEKALLNYERARLFIPSDSDLRSNHDYALSKARDGMAGVGEKLSVRVMNAVYGRLTVNELTVLISALYVLVVGLLLLQLFLPGSGKLTVRILALILAIALISGGVALRYRVKGIGTDAIVSSQVVDAKFEPFDSATTFFQLTLGDKIRIRDSKDEWRKVTRADGRAGWVKADALDVI